MILLDAAIIGRSVQVSKDFTYLDILKVFREVIVETAKELFHATDNCYDHSRSNFSPPDQNYGN